MPFRRRRRRSIMWPGSRYMSDYDDSMTAFRVSAAVCELLLDWQ